MKTNKIKWRYVGLIMAGALVASIVIGGTLAYFTDKTEVYNSFVFGNVEIVPNEPNWDPEDPFVPNEEVPKDPQIANNGNTEAVVFIKLQVPVDTFTAVNDDGTKGDEVTDEIFWLKSKDVPDSEHRTQFNDVEHDGNWVLLSKTDGAEAGSYNTYLFGYQKALGTSEGHISNVLHPDDAEWAEMTKTDTLFDKVQLKNFVEGTLLGDYNIKLEFYAIQAQYLTDVNGDDLTEKLFPNGVFDENATLDAQTLRTIYGLYAGVDVVTAEYTEIPAEESSEPDEPEKGGDEP
ncbi:MAG: hypothetical protein J1G06_01710 [Oscillospiraceae bacterium]|nr:hypothetical protein [Oscillospiraceae bacterium]